MSIHVPTQLTPSHLVDTIERAMPHRKPSTSRRTLTSLGVLAGLALVAMVVQKLMFDRRNQGVINTSDGNPPSSASRTERNGTMTTPNTDEIKGRVKEAAGALTDNDNLKREGKTDQTAANVKDGLDKVKGKIEDGIDAVKEKINKN
jgi:uncharacterized protein YjbJ (UPF0337 family)